jgi:hypothetical protein
MKITTLLFAVLFLFTVSSCSEPERYEGVLSSEFEKVINEHPDSAVNLLEKSEYKNSTSRSLNARYSLYLSLARYKNGEDAVSDSLLKPAIDYYISDKTSNSREKMLTTYLLAHINNNIHQDSIAYALFEKAIQLGKKLNDSIYPALALHAQGVIFGSNFYTDDAATKFKQGLNYLDRFKGLEKYKVGMLLSIARSFNSPDSFMVSKKYTETALNLNNEMGTDYFLPELYENLGTSYFYGNNLEKANEYYKKSQSYGYQVNYKDMALWAIAALQTNDSIAFQIRDAIRALPTSSRTDDLAKYSMEKYFALHENDIHMVNNYSDSMTIISDEIKWSDLKPILPANSDSPSHINWTIILIPIFVAVSGVVILFYRKKHTVLAKDKTAENNSDMAIDKPISLSLEKVDSISHLNEKYEIFNTWFASGDGWRDNLSSEEIAVATNLIDCIHSQPYISQMIRDIDNVKENVASSIVSEFKLKLDDQLLLLLYLCNVSYKAIAVIVDKKASTASSNISRWKARLSNSNSPNNALYKKYLYSY